MDDGFSSGLYLTVFALAEIWPYRLHDKESIEYYSDYSSLFILLEKEVLVALYLTVPMLHIFQ